MRTPSDVLNIMKEQGIMPMYFTANETAAVNALKALYRGGIRLMEFTNRGPEALQVFKALQAARNESMKDMLVGVGTIKTPAELPAFIQAGADFVVCPGMIPEVGKACIDAGLLWAPGCMTVTEIMIAEQTGAILIKLFPGNVLTPAYIGAVKEIFPTLSFIPTGGVELDRDNMVAWYKAGACAVGMGSKLVSKPLMESERYDTIEERAKKALEIIQHYRKPEVEKTAI